MVKNTLLASFLKTPLCVTNNFVCQTVFKSTKCIKNFKYFVYLLNRTCVDIRGKILSIYLANMELNYWSVCSFSRIRGDRVMGEDEGRRGWKKKIIF